ncbi:hypothetical protein DL95DRAFT_471991 [Leptodontidium sp. 2 PMI_412]|nr:hypothetical protein DL95DRAFT_471991 [Leptodontidium sp. 2 PMI_412]
MIYLDGPCVEELVQGTRKAIAFEDDPHNTALQDNPKGAKIMSLSFGPPIGLGVATYASIIFLITNGLGNTGGHCMGAVAIILGNALYVHSNWRCIFCKSIISKVVASVRTAFTYFPPPRPRGDYNKSR